MRDFLLPEEPDLLPEDFQLDDPFAAEFISEPLPGTKAVQEAAPVEDTPEEIYTEDEMLIDEEILIDEDIPTEEYPTEYNEETLENALEEDLPYEDAPQELPLDFVPEEMAPLEEPVDELTEEPLPPSIDPDVMEEKLERPPHKGRPKRRSKVALFGLPHLAAAAIWLFVILAIGVSVGRILWVCAADVLAFGREEKIVTVSITHADDMDSIAKKLQEAGLIQYEEVFKLYAKFSHADQKISTGTYTLNTIYDYHALVGQMTASSKNRAIIEGVLIPEGYTCRQIFNRLEERGVCTVAELEAYAATGDLGEYWFLEGVERGDRYCLEGYLFPATYDFYENSTPKQVLTRMLNAFEQNFTEELYAQLDVLNGQLRDIMVANGKDEAYIADNLLDLRDLINVASLIEKESSGAEESPSIASVIYNRLYQWGDTPRYLNIDASIIYALDGKTNLTSEDMGVDSPYNTYNRTGLPIGPIANPGLASIKAALAPATTPYYYYVLDPSVGTHIFAKTYDEHKANVEKVSQYVAPTEEEVSYG